MGAIFFAALVLIIAGFVWQGASRFDVGDPAAYFIGEAVPFVFERLSDRAMAALDPDLTRRILEWNLHFTQVIAPRDLGRPAIIGSGEGIEYVMDRARAMGIELEPIDIAEVMAIETEYLLDIGAIGRPVEEEVP